MAAWQEVQSGRPNPLIADLESDAWITTYLSPEQIEALAVIEAYTGIAPQRARQTASRVRTLLEE
jgi:hypothetical protein